LKRVDGCQLIKIERTEFDDTQVNYVTDSGL